MRLKQLFLLILVSFNLLSCANRTEQTQNIISKPKAISSAEAIFFAKEAALVIYNYNYKNHQQHIAEIKKYFTPSGFKAYQTAFFTSGNVEIIKNQKLIVSSKTIAEPVLLRQGYVDLIYTWETQVPLLVTYKNDKQLTQTKVLVNMTLVQVLGNINSRGIAINRFNAQSEKNIMIKAK